MRYISAYPSPADQDIAPPTFGVEPYIHPTSQVDPPGYRVRISSFAEARPFFTGDIDNCEYTPIKREDFQATPLSTLWGKDWMLGGKS